MFKQIFFWFFMFLILPVSLFAQITEDNYNRAYVYTQKGMYQDALKEYQSALSQNPDKDMETRIRFNMSIIYDNLDMKEESLNQLLKAIEINPALFVLHLNLAHTYKDLGRNQEAITEFNKALEIDSNYADVYLIYYNLGHIYNKMANYEEAVKYLDKSLSLKPDHIGSMQQLAYSNIGLKKFDDAEKILNKLESLNSPQKELFEKLQNAKSQK